MAINTSVLITNFNYGRYIGRCIRSCLNQTMNKETYEIIVIDDHSTDESKEVIKSFEGRIRSIFLRKNMGVAFASNVGIKKALGMFVIRVDSDDYINENTLQFMTEILLHNADIGFVYGDIIKVDENGNRLERLNMRTLHNLLNHGAGIMFRKSHLEMLGLYNKDLKTCEDYDLIARYLKNFDGYHLPLPFYRYTRHDKNMTSDIRERKKWKKKVLIMNKLYTQKRG